MKPIAFIAALLLAGCEEAPAPRYPWLTTADDKPPVPKCERPSDNGWSGAYLSRLPEVRKECDAIKGRFEWKACDDCRNYSHLWRCSPAGPCPVAGCQCANGHKDGQFWKECL